MRVLAAMSGGVDSSVAAALTTAEGHEVIGVTLKLWEGPGGEAPTAGCCTLSDAEDARRVAATLDIPYYVLDYTDPFREGVVDRFISDYLRGRTPNPCVECNRSIKFDLLLQQARQLACDMVVTGHYARVRLRGGRYDLLRGVDPTKDQSYVLYMLGQEELAMTRFPVGGMTKSETRRIASDLGLRTATKPDSQEVCFVGRAGYRTFLRDRAAITPGPIEDLEGRVVGSHAGVTDFTVGQRRGLGITLGEARFVLEVRPSTQTVVIGGREDLFVSGCEIEDPSWVSSPPQGGFRAQVQLRYREDPGPAFLERAPFVGPASAASRQDHWRVWFDRPRGGVAPGQAAVFYEGERVLGGGTIAGSLR